MKFSVQVTRNQDQFVEVEADTKEEAEEEAIFKTQDHIGEQGEELWSDYEYVATADEDDDDGK